MKHLLCVSIFLLLAAMPLATTAQKVNIDSLWSVWEDESQPDSNRFNP